LSPLPIKRQVKTADGKEQAQSVPPTQYRALRWFMADLPTGKSISVTARARITGTEPVRLK
jgi:hypothetical protein